MNKELVNICAHDMFEEPMCVCRQCYRDSQALKRELVAALKTWDKFWDTMPKGQMGKLTFDVGLFNEGFIKMQKALARAEAQDAH